MPEKVVRHDMQVARAMYALYVCLICVPTKVVPDSVRAARDVYAFYVGDIYALYIPYNVIYMPYTFLICVRAARDIYALYPFLICGPYKYA